MSHHGNKIGELKLTQCSIKVSFQGQRNPQKYKIETKLLHLRHEIFCKLHILNKLVIYTFTFRYTFAQQGLSKSQILCAMHRIANGFKILFFPMKSSFLPSSFSVKNT